MKKIVLGLMLSIFLGLNLFAGDYEIGLEAFKKSEYKKASELLKKPCNNGNASGCFILGSIYAKGEGVKQDNLKAIELFKKSCDGGIPNGCLVAGSEYISGENIKQDTKKAAECFKKACDLGEEKGCKALSKLTDIEKKQKSMEQIK